MNRATGGKRTGQAKPVTPTNYSLIGEYARHVAATNRLSEDPLEFGLMGVFGEVGSFMEAAKKRGREGVVYRTFTDDAREELGDALWYFALICSLRTVSLEKLFASCAQNDGYTQAVAATSQVNAPVAFISARSAAPEFKDAIFALGSSTEALFEIRSGNGADEHLLTQFLRSYLDALQSSNLSLQDVISANISKTASRFKAHWAGDLPDFDQGRVEDERIPHAFEIAITKRGDGKAVLKWKDVIIGDPLTDNMEIEDGYRFHDVFHLAHAAVLGWSPVFRALIKHKRRSDPLLDEVQDGGRAIVIEEGLTAWLFARSEPYNRFKDATELPFDILKVIEQFVRGYEVQDCPLWLWEDAILQGYDVFSRVLENDGGIILGDRARRKLEYKALPAS